MNMELRSVHFHADEKLKSFIENKMSKLSQFYDKIIDTRVTLKLENSGQVKDKIAEVHVKVPGELLVVSASHKTFEGATEGAVRKLKRRLRDYKEKRYA